MWQWPAKRKAFSTLGRRTDLNFPIPPHSTLHYVSSKASCCGLFSNLKSSWTWSASGKGWFREHWFSRDLHHNVKTLPKEQTGPSEQITTSSDVRVYNFWRKTHCFQNDMRNVHGSRPRKWFGNDTVCRFYKQICILLQRGEQGFIIVF